MTSIDQHADYDSAALTSDLSLLHLAAPFDLDDEVATVSLAGAEETAALTEAGDTAFVTGFGATGEDEDASDRLLEARVSTYADDRCETLYEEDGETVFGESQVCAGVDRGHIDACYGDSGGPLVVPTDADETSWIQVGVVSWGAGCGAPLRPTVYTEVAAFADWLEERGVGPPGTQHFDGEGARIPARGTEGKAATYPLTVEVEGFEGELDSGRACASSASSTTAPEDLDMWLVSPSGTVVTLLSDVGGTTGIDAPSILVVDQASPATGDPARCPDRAQRPPGRSPAQGPGIDHGTRATSPARTPTASGSCSWPTTNETRAAPSSLETHFAVGGGGEEEAPRADDDRSRRYSRCRARGRSG